MRWRACRAIVVAAGAVFVSASASAQSQPAPQQAKTAPPDAPDVDAPPPSPIGQGGDNRGQGAAAGPAADAPSPGPPFGQPYPQAPFGQPYANPSYPAPYGQPYANPSYPAAPYGPPDATPARLALYQSERKNAAVALIAEFFMPGLGSIYAGHAVGALVTWGLSIAGMALIVWDLERLDTGGPTVGVPTLAGVGVIVGARTYGFVDAYSSTTDYNSDLARRLGLPELALGVTPIRTPGQGVAWGPSLSLRF